MKLVNFLDIIKSGAVRNCRRYSSIEIPKRVKRDSLSILKALSSVTKPDYLAPQYRFIDDPYLIPYSNIDKREYSLSFVSGKNAARFVMNKYSNLFEHSTAHPEIKDFMPPSGPSTPLDTVEGLKERISMRLPIESYDSYRKLFDEGIEVPRIVLDDLFDLLCFTNHETLSPPTDLIELYMQGELMKPIPEQRVETQLVAEDEETSEINNLDQSTPRNWKTQGAAEILFSEITDPSPRNICSFIKGMVKFSAYEKAYEKYLSGLDQNVEFDVSTYNAIISGMAHLNMTPGECIDAVFEVLRVMDSKRVIPNVKTFNNILEVFYNKGNYLEDVQGSMKRVLSEMRKCGIEPTLTTWFNVIRITYPNYKLKNNILPLIIEKLGQSEITIREPDDFEFFVQAMSICARNFRNAELAKSINNLVIGNENLLGDSRNLTSFYSNYLMCLGNYGSVEEFYSEYFRISPHTYSPTFKVFEIMLDSIADFGCYEYLPRVWSDMMMQRYSKRPDLLEKLGDILGNANVDDKLQLAFINIVDTILKTYIETKNFQLGKPFPLSGNLVSSMACVYLNSNEIDKCWEILRIWQEDEHLFSTIPNETALVRSCQAFIKENQYVRVHDVLKLITKYGYPCAEDVFEEALSSMTLSDDQKISLKNLL